MKSAVIVAVFIGLVGLAAANPHAFLLAALGQQTSPVGVDTLCDDLMPAMLGNLTNVCQGADLKPAYDAYASTCSEIGIKVANLTLPSNVSAVPTSALGSSASNSPDATLAPSSPTTIGDDPQQSRPSAAGAIAPHTFLFPVLGLSVTGLVSVVFL
ncbi:hypothetical protein CGRA01v4_01394 [Colletotrichum graminicola]|uniref:Uncharacterized protein n=1 Tax=Colletotrichum graminicola (strain M1.001 / M2 / FGSC 10212) TaxID=645133 RepID=E3QL95_COLGM|nr:uncharacterized protein GLRG_06922 [Colletotrichum graminicola M1.001]EFQ31633.1 hypothetical protein GLRG_06922 [Colletotrichum graminicola M1.001]WDK10115.1 hypothetical protein CGRA01v4_01394 [Colletotrichum graminicola]